MSLPAGVKARAGGRTRPVPQLPEPSRFWIGSAPRTWRVADRPWTDVAAMTLAGFKKPSAEGVPELAVEEVDDLFYIPPITADRLSDRDQLIAALIDRGVPILVHVFPGEEAPEGEGVIPLFDLLGPLLDGEDDLLMTLPAEAVAVWPLIPGITDDPTRWEEALEVLALRKVAVVQPQMLELSPMIRRRLAEGRSEEVFDALFHGRVRSGERRFAIHVDRAGLSPFFERPTSKRATPRQQANREVAASLALAGELSLRLGHSVAAGQAYFRAARGAETTSHDLRALAREKNLKVLDWLDERSLHIVEEQLADPPQSTRLGQLKAEYLEQPVPDDDADGE